MSNRCYECGAFPLDEDDTVSVCGQIICLSCADVEDDNYEEEEV